MNFKNYNAYPNETTYTFTESQIITIVNTGAYPITYNFDASVNAAGSVTLQPGDVSNDARSCTTLHVVSSNGIQSFQVELETEISHQIGSLSVFINVKSYSPVLDGSTDNTTKVQQALTDAHNSTSVKTVYIPYNCKWNPANITTYYNDVLIYDDSSPHYPSVIIGGGDAEYRLKFPGTAGESATNAPYFVTINQKTSGDRTSGIVGRWGTDASPQNTWQQAFGRFDGTNWYPDMVLYSWTGGQKNRLVVGQNGVFIFNANSAHFDPLVEATNGNRYIFIPNSEAAASDPLGFLLYHPNTGAINLDMRAGSDSYRKRWSFKYGDTKLRLKGVDLTTDIATFDDDGTLGVPAGKLSLNGTTQSYGVYYTGAPTAGTWTRGSIAWNATPSGGGVLGWVCVVGGTPGTWQAFGQIIAQSATAVATVTGGNVGTSGLTVSRVSPTAAVTGVILEAGTYAGQEVWVINEAASANSVTFASTGSNVADGSSDVISGGTARKFVWNSATSLWYKAS